jgi:ketosteroid isomerase-like protein
MSQENVEVVRRVYDALSGRDFNTFRALHDPDIELTPLRPEGATYRGHDGVRRYWDELFDVFPDFNAVERVTGIQRPAAARAASR